MDRPIRGKAGTSRAMIAKQSARAGGGKEKLEVGREVVNGLLSKTFTVRGEMASTYDVVKFHAVRPVA